MFFDFDCANTCTGIHYLTDVICSFVIQISVFPSSQEGHSAWQARNKKSGSYFLGDLKYFAATTQQIWEGDP